MICSLRRPHHLFLIECHMFRLLVLEQGHLVLVVRRRRIGGGTECIDRFDDGQPRLRITDETNIGVAGYHLSFTVPVGRRIRRSENIR